MVFSSLIFLYGFFPLSLLCYKLSRNQHQQNTSLLIFSLLFYSWGEPEYVLLLMFMAFTSWICARFIQNSQERAVRKRWVFAASAVDLTLIAYFKYAGFFCSFFGPVPAAVNRIVLPIGISFYTFQLLTYVVDVYRGEAQAQDSYWNVLLYAALFHQCIAGPIVRYQTIDRELFGSTPRVPEIASGVSRFCGGLAKKVLLANPCGALADALILSDAAASDLSLLSVNIQALSRIPVLGAWVGLIAYGLHIYLDFSAYSDMAIGMGRMIGLHYMENFQFPYISRSVTEFWRRWHISLGSFFRDYVYIPLGGSHCSRGRVIFNTFAVWLLTGLWHGASWNFLLWGLWFCLFILAERLFLKRILERVPVLSHLYLLLTVLLSWTIFRYSHLGLTLTLMRSLFGLNGNPLSGLAAVTQLQSNFFLLLAAIVAATPCMQVLRHRIGLLAEHSVLAQRAWNLIFYSLIPVVLLLLSTACLVGDSYNPFIYFRF